MIWDSSKREWTCGCISWKWLSKLEEKHVASTLQTCKQSLHWVQLNAATWANILSQPHAALLKAVDLVLLSAFNKSTLMSQPERMSF